MSLSKAAEYPEFFLNTGTPLLDSITIKHGPRKELTEFFLAADAAARDLGVTLRLHSDMHDLLATKMAYKSVWMLDLVPMLNPTLNTLTPSNSFWISGHDKDGRVVATQAARMFDLSQSTLLEAMQTLRLFVPEGSPWADQTTCTVEGLAAIVTEAIGGVTVTYSGAAWYHRDYKGRGLGSVIPRIGRSLAYAKWRSLYTFSIMEDIVLRKGFAARAGFTQHQPAVTMASSAQKWPSTELVWMDATHLLLDIVGYVAEAAKAVRVTEQEVTNEAPRSVQGNIKRS